MRSDWHKSSYSGHSGECVEVKEGPEMVLVRDTQNRELGPVGFTAHAWSALLGTLAAQ
ncbi:DUF397 domain-containing protein [Nocardiopsis synnemataformans]|uniref:DUF397 domain-containing protein n=1 Tax=Nocardiopsis synnemataformans TaxID=61305 RepID=UPI003EBD1E12